MRDILGREINQGDLVVIKPTGRNSSGLDIGVFHGKSVRFKNGKTASYNQFFKVANPDEIEMQIQSDILKKIKEEDDMLKTKTIPIKELEIGRLYKCKNGSKQYYFGTGNFEILFSKDKGCTWHRKDLKNKSGEGYLTVDYFQHKDKHQCDYDTLYWTNVRKSKPQFIEALDDKIDIISDSFEIIKERYDWTYQLNMNLNNMINS